MPSCSDVKVRRSPRLYTPPRPAPAVVVAVPPAPNHLIPAPMVVPYFPPASFKRLQGCTDEASMTEWVNLSSAQLLATITGCLELRKKGEPNGDAAEQLKASVADAMPHYLGEGALAVFQQFWEAWWAEAAANDKATISNFILFLQDKLRKVLVRGTHNEHVTWRERQLGGEGNPREFPELAGFCCT